MRTSNSTFESQTEELNKSKMQLLDFLTTLDAIVFSLQAVMMKIEASKPKLQELFMIEIETPEVPE